MSVGLIVVGVEGMDVMVKNAKRSDLIDLRRGLAKKLESHPGTIVVMCNDDRGDEAISVMASALRAGATLAHMDVDGETGMFDGRWDVFLPWVSAHLKRHGATHVEVCGFWDWEVRPNLSQAELLEQDAKVADIPRVVAYLTARGFHITMLDDLTMVESEDEEDDEDEEGEDDLAEDEEDDEDDGDEDDGDEDDEDEEGDEDEDEEDEA